MKQPRIAVMGGLVAIQYYSERAFLRSAFLILRAEFAQCHTNLIHPR